MADESKGTSAGTIVLAFLAGAAIGGAIALLTAPRSGRETREKIRGSVDDLRERLHHIVAEAEEKIRATVEEGSSALHEKQELVKAVVEAGKEAYAKEQAKHHKA
jgi:gas vesicle protein